MPGPNNGVGPARPGAGRWPVQSRMPVTFRAHTLDNGLTIIGEVDDAAHTAAAGFFVRTGARDEPPQIMGVSHFLEHMMFKGTPGRSGEEINRAFDAMGARANAYTSSELTAFHAAVLPEHAPTAIGLLADMLRPALRDEDFAAEKGVILEEIAMYQDDPGWVLYDRAMEEHYGGHPLALRVLGTQQTVGAMRVEQMREYFGARYSSDNTVVALAGRIDFDAAVVQVAGLCGSWRRTGAARAQAHPSLSGRAFRVRQRNISRAYRMSVSEGPGIGSELRYAAFVLAQALGSQDNSRLHWAIVEPGLAEEAEAGYEPRDGIGDLRVFVACQPERLEECWTAVEREIDALADTLTEDDIARVRARVATGVTVAGERPDGRMHRLGRLWSYLHQYSTLEEELARVGRVSLGDVRDLARALATGPRTVGTLLPETE
ncbi:MAG: peptidase M16 [Planctomyces sp.]|nr:peptidase M16 [Planctomyces sp.]